MSEDKTFEGLLEYFKQAEGPEMIMPIIEDKLLANAVIAWSAVSIVKNKDDICGEVTVTPQWNWLWSQIIFDLSEFGVIAGLQPHTISNVFKRIKGLKLIYPDGTINNVAKMYLKNVVMNKLKFKKPQGRPKKEDN